MTTYNERKLAFVSDHFGSSITHINLISIAALFSISLYSALKSRVQIFQKVTNASSFIDFLSQWLLLVFPLLLSMTVLANKTPYLNLILLIPLFLVQRTPAPRQGTMLPTASTSTSADSRQTGSFAPLPALTTYRAHMMLMTILAILAVDFPVFPRELAKCESFGVSLMDLGVGSFVFSQGVVSAIPILKNSSYINSALTPKVWSVTKKSMPIILLGVIRVLLVKGTEYPEHVTEYGVHWNFFITLALLPVLQVLLHPLLARVSIAIVAVAIAVLQQILLSTSLQSYVLDAERIRTIVSMNKEGIVSLLGYLSIHLFGLSTGVIVLPPTPGFFRRRQKYISFAKKDSSTPPNLPSLSAPRQTDKTATELCAYTILWWGAVALVGWIVDYGAVSRRLVNLRYILWIAAFNTSFLLSYIVVVDMWIARPGSSKRSKAVDEDDLSDPEEVPSDETSPEPGRAEKVEKARIEREKLRLKERESIRRRVKEREQEKESSHQDHSAADSGPNLQDGALKKVQNPVGNPPTLFDMVNRHGLVVFLGANLLTGLVNLTIPTIDVPDGKAMVVLSTYSLVVCGAVWVYNEYRKR